MLEPKYKIKAISRSVVISGREMESANNGKGKCNFQKWKRGREMGSNLVAMTTEVLVFIVDKRCARRLSAST